MGVSKDNKGITYYELVKVTCDVIVCSTCNGEREIHERVHHGKIKSFKCEDCKGTGEKLGSIETSALLTEALRDLGVEMKTNSK